MKGKARMRTHSVQRYKASKRTRRHVIKEHNNRDTTHTLTRGVSHHGLAIYIKN